ncbi:hypothetical protein AAFP35_14880 [Gordonia sp. CPCC 206044]|uniref:hypothetical protein n=1 Tax=Gordonia sp. CPCC 206044 TaxID=3140793 RepID=UPI003AF3DCFA
MAEQGHIVVIGSSEAVLADLVACELRSRGMTAFGAQLDLMDVASINEFADAALFLAGHVDLVVHVDRSQPDRPSDDRGGSTNRDPDAVVTLGVHHLVACLLDNPDVRRDREMLFVTPKPGETGTAANVSSCSAFVRALGTWATRRKQKRPAVCRHTCSSRRSREMGSWRRLTLRCCEPMTWRRYSTTGCATA